MRQLAIATLLMTLAFTGREASAQNFWYTPPGYDYGYYYGLDLGYGVGFGYGAGIGVPLTPQIFMQSQTGNIAEPQFDPESIGSTQVVPEVQWHSKAKAPQPKITKAIQVKKTPKATPKAPQVKAAQKNHS